MMNTRGFDPFGRASHLAYAPEKNDDCKIP